MWRRYKDFVEELSARFPHERKGIEAFYGECWAVFNALNSLELKSLEEPRYLLGGELLFDMLPRFNLRTPWGLRMCLVCTLQRVLPPLFCYFLLPWRE